MTKLALLRKGVKRPFMYTTLTSSIAYAFMIICLFLSLSPYSPAIPFVAGTMLPVLMGVWAAGVVIAYFYSKKIREQYSISKSTMANVDLRGHWIPFIGILSIYLITHQKTDTLNTAYIAVALAALILATVLPLAYFCSKKKSPTQIYPGVPKGVLALYIVPVVLGCSFLLI
jgi:hypothetical protein